MNLDDQQSMPLRFVFGLDKNKNRHGGGAIGKAFPDSTHLQSRPPKPWPRSGQTGDPNQAPTMTASRLMQQTATDDDIKYWMGDPDDPEDVGATFDPPAQFPSYYSDYMRVSHHWDSSPAQLGETEEYISNMEDLQELFGFKKKPSQVYRRLSKSRGAYTDRAREALKRAIIHRKFKEKIMASAQPAQRHIEMVESYEDSALDALKPLSDEIDSHVEFLTTYREDVGRDPSYESVLAFYQDLKNKVDQALFSVREATRMGAIEESILNRCIKGILTELKDAPLFTSLGRFDRKGKQAGFDIFVMEEFIIGIREDPEGYQAYNFNDGNYAYAATPELAIENVLTAEELDESEAVDEVSAVSGAAMGAPGQPSGQIRGHIGPLGPDNRSPHLKKKKKKKQYEPSMKAFGGAIEVD